MKKKFIALIIFLLVAPCCFCQQKTEAFHLMIPKQKIPYCLYNTLYFIDQRTDGSMGTVQVGAFNRMARVVAANPFPIQLKNVISSLTDTTAQNGRLLFQLRELTFSEITNAFSEYGFCHLRAKLYVVSNGFYQPLNLIDTLIVAKSMDVTNGILKKGATAINNFIAYNLTQMPSDTSQYSFADVRNIDNIEKLTIPVYNTSSYKDGLYKSYADFKNQTPGQSIQVEMKKDNISSVKIIDANGKTQKIRPQFIYAIVYQGQPYIANGYGYFPLQKIDGDFICKGNAHVSQSNSAAMGAGVMFGLLGALIINNGSSAKFEMKIDHINGALIKLRQMN